MRSACCHCRYAVVTAHSFELVERSEVPTLLTNASRKPAAPKLLALNVSAKFVPRIPSTERRVSVPIAASPVTIPNARLTLIPESAGFIVIEGSIEPTQTIDKIVTCASAELFSRIRGVVGPRHGVVKRRPGHRLTPVKVSVPTFARSLLRSRGKSRRQIYGHPVQCAIKGNSGVAVSGDAVVASTAFELVERTIVADVRCSCQPIPCRVKSSAKSLPVMPSIDRKVSVPDEASPWTVPAARLTVMPLVTASSEFVLYTARSKPLRPSMKSSPRPPSMFSFLPLPGSVSLKLDPSRRIHAAYQTCRLVRLHIGYSAATNAAGNQHTTADAMR